MTRRIALGFAALGLILAAWAIFVRPASPPARFKLKLRPSIETHMRSLIEPAAQSVDAPAWQLKRPYPSPAELEQAIGKADEQSSGYAWATKYIWRTVDGETVAWFSKADGQLEALELNYGGIERIARSSIDYHHLPAKLK